MNSPKLLVFLLSGLIIEACTPSGGMIAPPKLNTTGSPALHAIDSREMRQLMGRMNNLMYERNLTDQEMDVQRRQTVSQVVVAAEGIDQAIGGILSTLPKLKLDEGEQKIFHSLAVNLRDDAHTLKSQAQAHQIDSITVTLEKMSATCNACHELFRDFTKSRIQK